MIEGQIKQIFDIIQKSDGKKTYPEIMKDLLISGIENYKNNIK